MALCNLDGSGPSRLTREVADLYLADAFTEPAPAPHSPPAHEERSALGLLPASRFAEYAGQYYGDELDAVYVVTAVQGGIEIRVREAEPQRAQASGHDQFQVEDSQLRLQFAPGRHGASAGFTLSDGRAAGLKFTRLTAPASSTARQPAAP